MEKINICLRIGEEGFNCVINGFSCSLLHKNNILFTSIEALK